MKEETAVAKIWFRSLLDGCYTKQIEKYPDYIFWIYNPELIRLKKLNRIINPTINKQIHIDNTNDTIYFRQELKSKYFRINYTDIWSFFETKYNLNYDEIQSLTQDVVADILKSKEYTTLASTLFLSINGSRHLKK